MKKTPPVKVVTHPLDRRRWFLLLGGAVAVALLWRLVVSWQIASGKMAGSVFLPPETTDLRTYMDLSRAIAAGEFEGPFYYQPFYYSVFLVVARWISGGSVWAVIILQALLGAATTYLAGITACKAAGRIAGVAAAYLTALCTILVFYTPFHQIATLQTFNVTLLAYLALKAFQSEKYRYTAWMAAVAAIGALTRGNVLLVFVPLVAGLVWKHCRKKAWKKSLATVLISFGVFLLVESPFIVYNTIQLGRLSGPSTAADAVLALGNTPEAPPGGRNPGLPSGPMEYPQAYEIWMSDAETNPVWKKILNYAMDEPLAYAELTFRKLLLFWDYREIPNNVALAGEGTTSRWLDFTIPVGVIIAFALAGIFLSLKKIGKNRILPLFLIVFFYWGATAAFYNLSRFRAPVLPVLAVFAGIYVAMLLRHTQIKDWKFVRIYGVLSLLLGVFITWGAYEFYRQNLESSVMRAVRPNGTILTLPDKRNVYFYHGPQTFGDWQVLEVKKSDTLQVVFPVISATSNTRSELEFSVQSMRNGWLTLDINGKLVRIHFLSPEFKKIKVELPENSGKTVTIKVVLNSAEAVFIVDLQRNYGASSFNGEVLPGELVMRLTR